MSEPWEEESSAPAFSGVAKASFQPGTYMMELEEVKLGEKKAYKSEKMEPAIIFKFSKDGSAVFKRVKPSVHEKSTCRKFVQSMTRSKLKAEVLNDGDAYWRHIKSLVGDRYTVVLSESDDGKYNNIESVSLPLIEA